MKEERDIEKVSDEEREILRIVRDEGEISAKEIAQKLGINDLENVKRLSLKLAKQDLLDSSISGKLVLNGKGEKIFQSEKQYNWR